MPTSSHRRSRLANEERKANRPKDESVNFGTLIDFLRSAQNLINLIKAKLKKEEIKKDDLSIEEFEIYLTGLIKNESQELRIILANYLNIQKNASDEWIFGIDVFHWIWEHGGLGDRSTHSKAIHYNPASHYEKDLPAIDSREQHTRHGVIEGKPNLNELFVANKLQKILVGAVLSGGDEEGDLQFSLRRTNFSGLDCSYADFRFSLLENSLFINSKATASNFQNSTLDKAEFQKADLQHANFSHCYAPHTNFAEAKLNDSNMSHAILTKTSLRNATANNVDFTETHLNEADLSGASLMNVNLQSAKLYLAKVSGTDFSNSNFQEAECKNINCESTVNFQNCNLRKTNFYQAKVNQANFSSADMTDTNMEFVRGENCNFNGATLVRTNLHDAHFKTSSFANIDARESYFEGTYLAGSKISHVNFKDSNLYRACLFQCELSSVDFTNANLTDVNLCSTILHDIDFTNANLYHTRLYGVHGLTARKLAEAKNLKDIFIYVHDSQFYTYEQLIKSKKPVDFNPNNQEIMDTITRALAIQESKKQKSLSPKPQPKNQVPDPNEAPKINDETSTSDLNAKLAELKKIIATEKPQPSGKKELNKDAPEFQPSFSFMAKLKASALETTVLEATAANPKNPKRTTLATSCIETTEPASAPAAKAPPPHGWLQPKKPVKYTPACADQPIAIAAPIPLEVEAFEDNKFSVKPKTSQKKSEKPINVSDWCDKQVAKIFNALTNYCDTQEIQLQRTEYDQIKTLLKDFFIQNIEELGGVDLEKLSKIRGEIFERIKKAIYKKSNFQNVLPYNWQSTHGIRLNPQTHPENALDMNTINLTLKNHLEPKFPELRL